MPTDAPSNGGERGDSTHETLVRGIREGLEHLQLAIEASRGGDPLELPPTTNAVIRDIVAQTRQHMLGASVGPLLTQLLGSVRDGNPLHLPERQEQQRDNPVLRQQQTTRDQLRPVLSGTLEQLMRNAQDLHDRSPDDYHRLIRYLPLNAQGERQEERLGEHFFQAHLSNNPRPKPIVIMILGNKDQMVDSPPPARQRGINHLFNRLSSENPEDADVVKIRLGSVQHSADPRRHNALAAIHARNVVEDALSGKGVFNGRRYTSVTFVAYSYGAGLLDEMLRDPHNPLRLNGVPVAGTVGIDPIRFRGYFANTRRPPTSAPHLHIYQRNRAASDAFLAGGALTDPARPGDRQMEITGTTHRGISNIASSPRIRSLFDNDILGFVRERAGIGRTA